MALTNNLPIRSTSTPNISPRSSGSGPSASGSPLRRPGNAFDHLDIDKIGKGRFITEGSYGPQRGVNRYSGLKGQLMKLKSEGKHSVAENLSKNNIKQIHDLIVDRLSKKSVSSQSYFTKRDKIALMAESRKLVKSKDSDFTWEDRKDLMKIVSSIQKQAKSKIINRADNTSSSRMSGNTPSGFAHPPQQQTRVSALQKPGPNNNLHEEESSQTGLSSLSSRSNENSAPRIPLSF